MYIYISLENIHKYIIYNNVLSSLSLQCLRGNSHIWAHDEWLHIAPTIEPKCALLAGHDAPCLTY